MRHYFIYFRGSDPQRTGQWVLANTADEARRKFAEKHGVELSDYITYQRKAARRLAKGEQEKVLA